VLTSTADGAGLACGVFEHFLSLGLKRPKVLGATHFHEIFENGFLKPRPSLAFGYMEVRLDREAQDLGDQITYLYKYGQISTTKTELTTLTASDLAVVSPATVAGKTPYCLLVHRANCRPAVLRLMVLTTQLSTELMIWWS
jgi:hypothetical protein